MKRIAISTMAELPKFLLADLYYKGELTIKQYAEALAAFGVELDAELQYQLEHGDE